MSDGIYFDGERFFGDGKNAVEKGCLYLVATPIGNLSDISARALHVLSSADFVACEDTRITGRLLSSFGISKPLVSYFEHNKKTRGEVILNRLKKGESCALVTDAGTPAVSDPGADMVGLCRKNGIKTYSVPGPCAAVCALTLSGLDTGRFCFEGFLPPVNPERRQRLLDIADEKRTMILYEAPHRLKKTLGDLKNVLGSDRKISLCRELTKLNEETIVTNIGNAAELYETEAPKGEFALVIEGKKTESEDFADLSVEEHLLRYMKLGMDKSAAAKQVAKERKVPKNEIYSVAVGMDDVSAEKDGPPGSD